MLAKQNQQELLAIYKALEESLKPAVLLYAHASLKSKPEDIAKAEANSSLVNGYIQKNFTDANGVTDFSLENLRATVLALTDQLAWSAPPKNFGASQRAAQRNALNAQGMGSHKTEFDRPELNKPRKSVSDQLHEEHELVRRNKALVDTEKVIDSHRGATHARTRFERDQLRRERDRLIATKVNDIRNLTPDQAEAVRDSIEKKVREIKPSALGS